MKKFFISAIAVALVAAFAIPAMAVDFSGQITVRGEYDKNVLFHDDVPAERGADVGQKTILTATANPTDSTTVKVSLLNATAWGDFTIPAYLYEGYVQEDNIFGSDLSIRFGRQILSYDDQRIIGGLKWSLATPNFDDAIKLMYNSDEFDVDAFAAKKNECFLTEACDDDDLYGVHATIKTIADNTLSVYTFIEHEGSLTRYTLGARLKGEFSGVDYTLELPFQTGQESDTVDISAYAFAGRAGYNLGGANDIRIGGEFVYATGDDGTVGENGAFSVIQGTNHAHLGNMDQIGAGGMTDIMAYNINGSAKATPDLKVIGAYWMFTEVEVGVGVPDDLGSEIDVTAIYKYNKALTLKGGYSMFFPGDQQEFIDGLATETRHWGWLMAVSNF